VSGSIAVLNSLLLRAAQALTASCSDQERQRCAEAGMAGLHPKPIRLDTLKVRAMLLLVDNARRRVLWFVTATAYFCAYSLLAISDAR
jgi:CheY-like chemotaxis protein